jgi:hypothetical protein
MKLYVFKFFWGVCTMKIKVFSNKIFSSDKSICEKYLFILKYYLTKEFSNKIKKN